MQFKLKKEVLKKTFLLEQDMEKIFNFAMEEYPDECCGLVTGLTKGFENIVHSCTNIQNQLHKKDPIKYPRDAKTAYCINPKEVMEILKMSEKKSTIKAIYHSHPDHDVYFSEEDKKNALMFDEPIHPNAIYIILSLYNKKVNNAGFFIWDNKEKDFKKYD